MNKVKVYDIDAFVGMYYPEYEAFRYKKAVIFEGERGVIFAEEEAVHQREKVITDSVVVPLCQKSEEKDGHITMAIVSSAEMTVSLDEIVAKAPYEEKTIEEFFARRNYNPRCQDNYEDLMSDLRDIGFDLRGYFEDKEALSVTEASRYGDFQCDATGGCPTLFVVDWNKKEAWLEVNKGLFDENVPDDIKMLKVAQELCEAWGKCSFANITSLQNVLRGLGEEAFENCWPIIEHEWREIEEPLLNLNRAIRDAEQERLKQTSSGRFASSLEDDFSR